MSPGAYGVAHVSRISDTCYDDEDDDHPPIRSTNVSVSQAVSTEVCLGAYLPGIVKTKSTDTSGSLTLRTGCQCPVVCSVARASPRP